MKVLLNIKIAMLFKHKVQKICSVISHFIIFIDIK
jgi:hypothetical protein